MEGNVNIQCSYVTISAGIAGNGGNGIPSLILKNFRGYKGYGGKGAKAVSKQLVIANGSVNVEIIDSEDGQDGEGDVYITPGHPDPVPKPGPVVPGPNIPIIK